MTAKALLRRVGGYFWKDIGQHLKCIVFHSQIMKLMRNAQVSTQRQWLQCRSEKGILLFFPRHVLLELDHRWIAFGRPEPLCKTCSKQKNHCYAQARSSVSCIQVQMIRVHPKNHAQKMTPQRPVSQIGPAEHPDFGSAEPCEHDILHRYFPLNELPPQWMVLKSLQRYYPLQHRNFKKSEAKSLKLSGTLIQNLKNSFASSWPTYPHKYGYIEKYGYLVLKNLNIQNTNGGLIVSLHLGFAMWHGSQRSCLRHSGDAYLLLKNNPGESKATIIIIQIFFSGGGRSLKGESPRLFFSRGKKKQLEMNHPDVFFWGGKATTKNHPMICNFANVEKHTT